VGQYKLTLFGLALEFVPVVSFIVVVRALARIARVVVCV
jgi:hypothetical protein